MSHAQLGKGLPVRSQRIGAVVRPDGSMSTMPLPESIALPPPMLTMQSASAWRAAWAPRSSTEAARASRPA